MDSTVNMQSGCKRKASSDLQCSTYPKRNLHKLYCQSITYQCSIGSLPPPSTDISNSTSTKPCVPCAYKICNFDIALDTEFTKITPNQRPEQCPRSSVQYDTTNMNNNNNDTMGYKRGMNVLTVGDGDFTFSLAVARLVLGNNSSKKKKKKQKGMVIATSYEDHSTLCKVYPDFDNTLESLKSCSGGRKEGENVIIGYNVDATRLNDTLPKEVVQHQSSNSRVKFDRICWNFPCTAITSGQDGQNDAMEENKELVRKFVANALPYLHNDGEIHMCHKTKPPYNHWGLEKVALEVTANGSDNGRQFEYKGRVVLDKCTLPPYTPRKALDKKSFPCHDACFYVFGWRRNEGDDATYQQNATIPDNDKVDSAEEQPDLSSIIKVTEKVVETIRSTHLSFKRSGKGKSSSKWNGKYSNKRRRK